jgi:hypothetical protein
LIQLISKIITLKILIEGEDYPTAILQNIFDDSRFYIQNGLKGKITSVGYYHSFRKNILVYMLPKVFMKDEKNTIFGITKEKILEIDTNYSIKHSKHYNWIRQSLVYFYNSLLEYRKRINNSQIINASQTFDLNSNLGDKEYSYLDLLLSFVNFYKKNKNYIHYKHIEFTSKIMSKPKWEKTVIKTLPILTRSKIPVYISVKNKKKIINLEEELITYFFSILNHFNIEHNLFIKIDKSYRLYKGNQFSSLQKNGLLKLKKIKYRYFNEVMKRMYSLCEMYFSKVDTSNPQRRKEEFLSVNNYNLVFENMVDKLFSDKSVDDYPLDNLKYNDDGKIIDHIYVYQSIIDTSNIFYIGDSKYYKSNHEAGKLSNYKQITYAKNIIQFNIDSLNNEPFHQNNIRYRDELTEGYNITPNFFIYGYIENERNFVDPLIIKKGEPTKSYHFKTRLFDRDTLFIHKYKINFLYVLKAYSFFDKVRIKEFQTMIKANFRKHFIDFFNDINKCEFEFFECVLNKNEYSLFIEDNFKILNGKCYLNSDGNLILAKHREETLPEEIMLNFEVMKKFK